MIIHREMIVTVSQHFTRQKNNPFCILCGLFKYIHFVSLPAVLC